MLAIACSEDDAPLQLQLCTEVTYKLASSSSECESEGLEMQTSLAAELSDQGEPVEINMTDDQKYEPESLPVVFAEQPSSSSKETWTVGVNCGQFVGRRDSACVQPQSQVLICNVVSNLTSLPKDLLKGCMQSLKTCFGRQSLPVQSGARLLGMSAATVESVWRTLRGTGFQPASCYIVYDGYSGFFVHAHFLA